MRAGLRTTRGSFWRCCGGCGEKGSGYQCSVPAEEVRVVGIAGAGRAVSSTKVGCCTCSWGLLGTGAASDQPFLPCRRCLEHHIHSTSAASVGMTDGLRRHAYVRHCFKRYAQQSVVVFACSNHISRDSTVVSVSVSGLKPVSLHRRVTLQSSRARVSRMEILTLSISGP